MIAMKRNKVGHLIRTAVLLLLPLGAGAQAPAPRHSAEVAWGVSVPLGTGYPDKTGAAAFSLRYEYRFAQRWAAGVSVAWDRTADNGVFDGHFDGDAVTGYAERTRQQIPITATLRWYMLGGRTSLLQPYLGAGVGAQWTRFDITGEFPNCRNIAQNFRRSFRRSASACRFVMVRAENLSPGNNLCPYPTYG